MTTTEQNPAREEFFDQLQQLHVKWFEAPSEEEEHPLKEEILSITYDANVALQKRVEELEAVLKWSNDRMQESVYWIEKVNDVRSVDTVAHIDLQIEENNRLLTPKQ